MFNFGLIRLLFQAGFIQYTCCHISCLIEVTSIFHAFSDAANEIRENELEKAESQG